MAVTLQEAIAAARRRCPGDEWLLMSPREQTRVIYREMRRLDQEELDSHAMVFDTTDPNQHPASLDARGTRGRAGASPEARPVLCQASVRTRSSGRCAWKATVRRHGVPYCGFHARLEEAQRARACVAVDAV
jgi:hypothetical protein